MFAILKDSTRAVIFTLLVLALAIGFSFIPNIDGFFYMLTPTIATLLMMFVVTRDGYKKAGWKRLGLHKLGLKGWAAAMLVPIIPIALGAAIVWGSGLGSYEPGPDFQGFAWSTVPLVLAFVYVKSVFMESMGEELGWRGYLLPVLIGSMGKRKAVLLNGFIHGIWHFPIILLTDVYHADQSLWLLLPLTVLGTMALAPLMCEIRLRTGSVWTSSIMHTSHNMAYVVLGAVTVNHAEAAKYIAGDLSIVNVLFYLALTFWLWRKKPAAAAQAGLQQ